MTLTASLHSATISGTFPALMPPPAADGAQGGGPLQASPPPATVAVVTAASVAPKTPRLSPVPITHRPLTYDENIPALLFMPIEVDQLNKQRENTLIMKFLALNFKKYALILRHNEIWGRLQL